MYKQVHDREDGLATLGAFLRYNRKDSDVDDNAIFLILEASWIQRNLG